MNKIENSEKIGIVGKMKSDPTIFYALSIAASWAGVGSLMNFNTLAQSSGLSTAVIWGAFNILACGVFGALCVRFPSIIRVLKTRPVMYFLGFLTLFQAWTQMNGIMTAWADTPVGSFGGEVIVYVFAVGFAIYLISGGVVRNTMTDSGAWVLVYALVALCAGFALVQSGGVFNDIDLGANYNAVAAGFGKGYLLLAGPFTYAFFIQLFSTNEGNEDGIAKADLKKSFVLSSVMFGIYMLFSAFFAFVSFTPEMAVMKAVLLTLIGVSSLSTYLYSEYVCFGKWVGIAANVVIIAGWQILIPLGVLGVWTLMAEIRLPFVALIVAAGIGHDVLKVKETGRNERC